MKTHLYLHSRRPSYRSAKGFTLIELLIVITIIALLAAILFPVFGRARENARRASCQSQLKQIGLAIMQYTQDYDERVMGWSNDPNGSATNIGKNAWQTLALPYLKEKNIFRCPSNTTNNQDKQYHSSSTSGEFIKRSYAANGWFATSSGNPYYNIGGTPPMNGFKRGNPLSAIVYPSETLIITETTDDHNAVDMDNSKTPSGFAADLFSGHLGTTNYLFMDGHVKALKPTATNREKNLWSIEDDGPVTSGRLFDRLNAAEAEDK